MRTPTPSRYPGYRFPTEIISHAVWIYFCFRMVEELLSACGILVSHESVRQWALKFGQEFAKQIRRRLPLASDKWHLDEVVLKIAGVTHWLWRAVDKPASCSTFSSRADATSTRPNAYFASC